MFDNILKDKTIIEKRISICKSCENYKFGFCSKCSCLLEGKIRVKSAFCPVEKWGAAL